MQLLKLNKYTASAPVADPDSHSQMIDKLSTEHQAMSSMPILRAKIRRKPFRSGAKRDNKTETIEWIWYLDMRLC